VGQAGFRVLGEELAVGVSAVLPQLLATVWLARRGSPSPSASRTSAANPTRSGRRAAPPPRTRRKWVRAGGWRTAVFSRSLSIVMATLFVPSWPAQSIAGLSADNEDQLSQLTDPLNWRQYLASPDLEPRRTGSPSSSPSARWPYWVPICASAAHRNPNPSAPRDVTEALADGPSRNGRVPNGVTGGGVHPAPLRLVTDATSTMLVITRYGQTRNIQRRSGAGRQLVRVNLSGAGS
jgi:hypothetical protein